MSCSAQILTEEQQAKLISKGAHPRTANPVFVNAVAQLTYCGCSNSFAELITCGPNQVPNTVYASPSTEIQLFFQMVDSSGNPKSGQQISIGSQTLTTDSNGNAGPFGIENDGSAVLLPLTLLDSSGNPASNYTVVLNTVSKQTNSEGQVTFFISPMGAVS